MRDGATVPCASVRAGHVDTSTTRTTSGTAILRSDLMSLIGDMNADSFRKEFFVPADAPLQRVHIDANLDEGGLD